MKKFYAPQVANLLIPPDLLKYYAHLPIAGRLAQRQHKKVCASCRLGGPSSVDFAFRRVDMQHETVKFLKAMARARSQDAGGNWQGSCDSLGPDRLDCANPEHWSSRMKHHHDLRRTLDNGSKEAVQTSALISDLDRIVRIIDEDIAREEKESGVFNRSTLLIR